MIKTPIWLALLAIVSIPSLSSAATNIDVLIVFSDDSGLSSFEKTLLASRYQQHLTYVYDEQLDGAETITVWPLLAPEMSYTAANKTGSQALQWMEDENDSLISALRIGREALGNPGADLVLMVVPDTTSAVCGQAGPGAVPLVTSTSESESFAFAIVVLEENDPDCLEEIVVPHEIGHLLYAEHQYDMNGQDLLPSYSNHATQSSASVLKSLMWDPITPSVESLLSGFIPNMTTGWADNVEFMSSDSFDVVSGYRAPPPPPPPPPGFTIEWEYCLGATAVYALDWWAAPGTVGPVTFKLEQRVNFIWLTAYEGGGTHVTFGCPNRTYFRVKATNSGGSSPWIYRWAVHDCDGLPD